MAIPQLHDFCVECCPFRRKGNHFIGLLSIIKHNVYPVFLPQKLMHVRITLAQRTVSAKMYLKVFNAIVSQDSQERIAPVRGVLCTISTTRDAVSSGYPNIEKRVEIATRKGVFLKKSEVYQSIQTFLMVAIFFVLT